MNNVVSCYLMGGLGNQLFQIFSTLAYGLKTTRIVLFPYTDKLTTGISRNTYWNSFLKSLMRFTVFNRNDYNNDSLLLLPRYIERGFLYSEIPRFPCNPELLLYGYFQSYKYFESQKTEIFSLIELKKQQINVKALYKKYFETYKTISMHFRIGDYKNIQDCHPLMTYDYYRKALNYILSYQNEIVYRVLYFCEKDDISDVSIIINKLRIDFDTIEFIIVDNLIPDWQQMLLMSCCNHNIIANSSFSWWGDRKSVV